MALNGRRLHPRAGLLAALVIGLAVTLGAHSRAGTRTPHAAATRQPVAPSPIRRQLDARLDSLDSGLEHLGVSLRLADFTARPSFRHVRRLFKQSEGLIAFYAPGLFSTLNGPVEADDPEAPPPRLGRRPAFGIIEAAVFGNANAGVRLQAQEAIRDMRGGLANFRSALPLLDVSDSAALDASRLELGRIATVGIAGFDSDESGDAIAECAAAIDGVRDVIELLQSPVLDTAMRSRARSALRSASADLRRNVSFGSADRFEFVAHHAIPSAHAVLALRRAIDARPVAARRLWRPDVASPYDADAFDPGALAPEYAPPASPALVALGARLFVDPNLSGDRTRSCASCHQQSRAFTDGLPRATAMHAEAAKGARNTPTLFNAAIQPAMFADQRVGFLEDQIAVVLSNPTEMGSSPDVAARRIRENASYTRALARTTAPGPVDGRFVRVALAAYVRSLVGFESPFDRAIRGDSSALSASGRRGFNLFMGKARCGTCHFAPTFGGTMPPDFARSELEIVGVPDVARARNARLDADLGRMQVDGAAEHRGAFRVPSVRNSAVTAPYMHNGAYRTLAAVIDFYDHGGGAGIGIEPASQTLSPNSLHLSPAERTDLIAFLRSLTDTNAAVAKP